jgi:hypothetical protein
MKSPLKYLFPLLVLIISSATQSVAQQKPAPTLKPPPLQSFWGTTNGGDLPLEFVLGVLDSAVWVMDDKKIRYSISRFIIVYRSKDKYEDEKTGEIKTRFNPNSTSVKNSALLPELWRKNLYETIKKEDELIIADVIVRDKKGNYFSAPDVKIIIK